MKREDFEELLLASTPEALVTQVLFAGIPAVFEGNPEHYDTLRGHVSDQLKVSADAVCVVGSAKVGFSLSPDTYPRPFGEHSDIDVAVVSERLFDFAWSTILEWHYPRFGRQLMGRDAKWMSRRRRDIYWGWLSPTEIRFPGVSLPSTLKPLRDFSSQWFSAFKTLGRMPQFAAREVNGRLYRTWDHALKYHSYGLRSIRERIVGGHK